MVKSCSAYNCTNRHNAFDKHIKFFKFPSNPVKLKAWVRNIRRVDKKHKDWMPNKHSYICSVHFKPECMYTVKEGGRTRLKPDAVSTEFDFPSHFIKVIKERQTPRRTRRAPSPQQVPAVDISIDHNYGSKHVSELDKVKEQLKISQKQVTRSKIKLKQTRRKLTARTAEIENLKDILLELKDREMLKCEEKMFLNSMLPEATTELFRNAAKNAKRTNGRSFSTEVKSFVMSLYFMSPKAYDFVREKLFLPHKSTLHAWFKAIDGDPGFTEEVFSFLKKMSEDNKTRLTCSLAMDEMAIRKEIIFQGGTQTGFFDYGTDFSVELEAPAEWHCLTPN
ncbi:hypothetical protein JTE90_020739 [Oedothorax gibbosus]|uniref:THAP-type domain-containing protein n=1 Tax=Oedothorax gibbosus TaxID=931172 RepID=A0AAV6TUE3_9ARAC|nr:hypothetical protein JTE90_020739 [Oedothorax gibbosus]